MCATRGMASGHYRSPLGTPYFQELTSKDPVPLDSLHGMRVEKAQAAPGSDVPAFVELQVKGRHLPKSSMEKPLK